MYYNVNYLSDTKEIIDAALNGARKFKLRTDEVQEILDKYDLDFNDKKLKQLFENGTIDEWFVEANLNNELSIKLRKYLGDFISRINNLKNQNINLYRNVIRMFNDNMNMSNDEIDKFSFPYLKDIDNGTVTII